MPSRVSLPSVRLAAVAFCSLCIILLPSPATAAFQFRSQQSSFLSQSVPTSWEVPTTPILRTFHCNSILCVTKDDNNGGDNVSINRKSDKAKGVYVRPSGAIERGSGFFFPGLEGPRVRVLFGTVLLGLTALNHQLALASTGYLSLEEWIAIGYSLLVLFQAAIEYEKEELIFEGKSTTPTTSGGKSNSLKGASSSSSSSSLLQRDFVQQWNANASSSKQSSSASFKDKVQWAAASYLSMTPATQMLLLTKDDDILYRLGRDSSFSTTTTTTTAMTNSAIAEEGVEAALDQLRQSKGGRLALPPTHPAVLALGLQDARTVVLQRITDDSCWVMSSSDQLLASFTPSDLKWLGQLARYIYK